MTWLQKVLWFVGKVCEFFAKRCGSLIVLSSWKPGETPNNDDDSIVFFDTTTNFFGDLQLKKCFPLLKLTEVYRTTAKH